MNTKVFAAEHATPIHNGTVLGLYVMALLKGTKRLLLPAVKNLYSCMTEHHRNYKSNCVNPTRYTAVGGGLSHCILPFINNGRVNLRGALPIYACTQF